MRAEWRVWTRAGRWLRGLTLSPTQTDARAPPLSAPQPACPGPACSWGVAVLTLPIPPSPPPCRHPGSYSKRPPPGVRLSEEQETAPWHAAGASLQGIQYLEEESEESTSGPLNRLLGEGREGRGPSAVLGPVSPPGRWGRATCLK